MYKNVSENEVTLTTKNFVFTSMCTQHTPDLVNNIYIKDLSHLFCQHQGFYSGIEEVVSSV